MVRDMVQVNLWDVKLLNRFVRRARVGLDLCLGCTDDWFFRVVDDARRLSNNGVGLTTIRAWRTRLVRA
jgi:hypothetical protein